MTRRFVGKDGQEKIGIWYDDAYDQQKTIDFLKKLCLAEKEPTLEEALTDINAGVDLNATFVTPEGKMSFVEAAAECGFCNMIAVFAFKRADFKLDNCGEKACRIAARNGDCNSIKVLAAYGVDVNAADENGDNACVIAARNGHMEAVYFLMLLAGSSNLHKEVGKDGKPTINRILDCIEDDKTKNEIRDFVTKLGMVKGPLKLLATTKLPEFKKAEEKAIKDAEKVVEGNKGLKASLDESRTPKGKGLPKFRSVKGVIVKGVAVKSQRGG